MKVQVTKATKQWVLKPRYESTQQLPFRRELLDRVMELRAQQPLETRAAKEAKKKRPSLPRPNIAKVDRPEMSVLLSRTSERFRHHKRS